MIMSMNAVQELARLGQSIWFDNISRSLIAGGGLKKLVGEGLRGVTSNPTIFDKAISGSNDYDSQIREIVKGSPETGPGEIIQALMIRDIQMATDVLTQVYDKTSGLDGYVSVEVTPNKARDTAATLEEVRLLWTKIKRKNLMIKIPATKEGLPAIETAIREGININVTLIFSVERYREVAHAYIAGLEARLRDGKPLNHVASVASVFVSRVDTLVDDLLQKKIGSARDAKEAESLRKLQGKAAVANTQMVYQAFKEIFEGPGFKVLRDRGATFQRPLWGSTGTKNPSYSTLLYVETLVGPHTVNTVPPATYDAIKKHLKPTLTIEQGLVEAREVLRNLASAGIDMPWVMKKLEDDGVSAFEKSFDGLYLNVQQKRDVNIRQPA